MFGGRNGTTQPVVDANTIIDGLTNADGTTQAGLKGVITEQVKADLGTASNGRLTQTQPTSASVQVSEETNDATRGKFGFSLAGKPSATGTAISVGYTTSTPTSAASFTLGVASQPTAGDTISFALKLPDGTSTTVTLAAAATASADSTSAFKIGADVNATAANISAALGNALQAAAGGALTASATARAAQNFFTGSASAGVTPQRVTFDANKNPTGYTAGTPQNTVVWYQGEDGGTDPRASQTVQISATGTVQTGGRANEAAIRATLAGLATVAFGLPDSGSANAGTAYQAISDRAKPLLATADTSPGVQDIVTSLSLAATRLSDAATTNTAAQNTLQDTLEGVEQAPIQETVVKLLDIQNRLQASYQLTSTLSKLSLVNYLS